MDAQTGLTNASPNAKPADPKQQAQFDLLLGRCRQVMEGSVQEWMATLKQSPVDGAVSLGTTTLRHMAQASTKAGQPVDPVVLINVGVQFCKDIAAVVDAAHLIPEEQLPDYLKQVMQQSIAEYLHMDAKEGLLSPEDKQRAAGMLGGQQPAAPAGPEAAPAEPEGLLAQMQKQGAPA